MKLFLVTLALLSVLGYDQVKAANPCSCSSQIYVAGAVITSPKYPANYCNNLNCVYYLQAIAGHRVKITIQSFQTEAVQDVLTVFDGPKDDDPETTLAALSGVNSVAPGTSLYSGGQTMTLRFSTDNGGTYKGFSLLFESVTDSGCGKAALSGNSAIIQTPNYPYNYPNGITCAWEYSAPNQNNAQVSFAPGASTELGHDFVSVSEDGKSLAVYSGSSGFKSIQGRDSNMRINFTSDAHVIKSGFQANFSNFAPPQNCECGLPIRQLAKPDQVGILTSPNYDGLNNTYCHNTNCIWYLEVPSSYNVHVSFLDFQLENFFDTLTVDDDLDGATLEVCSGSSCQPRTSSNQYMTIKFKTDTSVASKGFKLQFVAVHPASDKKKKQPKKLADILA